MYVNVEYDSSLLGFAEADSFLLDASSECHFSDVLHGAPLAEKQKAIERSLTIPTLPKECHCIAVGWGGGGLKCIMGYKGRHHIKGMFFLCLWCTNVCKGYGNLSF